MALLDKPRIWFTRGNREIHQVSDRVAVVWNLQRIEFGAIGVKPPDPVTIRNSPAMIAFLTMEKRDMEGLPLRNDAQPDTPFKWGLVDDFDDFADGMPLETSANLSDEIQAAITYARLQEFSNGSAS